MATQRLASPFAGGILATPHGMGHRRGHRRVGGWMEELKQWMELLF